ncbi:hypothetical protein OG994_25615 [Micromonospora globbae]|uniref:Uncharacterized protein n=1 Tax=Micromonospora globbae TaxID=1894969 RepID=A0ABZ1S5D0_9ACTN|nr:hypothetical protein [Micromonospora globbae]
MTSARNRWTSGLALSAMALGLAAVGIFVALAIVVTASYTPPPGQEPPKVTDWMQGWASIVGVAAALVAAGFTGWLLRFEMNQAREARAELAAEQRKANLREARGVISAEIDTAWSDNGDYLKRAWVPVANFGSHPVLQVDALVDTPKGFIVIPGPATLEPGGTWRTAGRILDRGTSELLLDELPDVSITLRYSDLSGQVWLRTRNGEPIRAEMPIPVATNDPVSQVDDESGPDAGASGGGAPHPAAEP